MTNGNKHIDNKIKESFEKLNKKAPEGLWTSISDVSDLNESEFTIRESFKNQEKTAPSNSWGKIKKQVIIDEVWGNIVLHEDKRKRRLAWWFSSASVFLLLMLIALFVPNNEISTEITKENIVKNQQNISSKVSNQEKTEKVIDTEALNVNDRGNKKLKEQSNNSQISNNYTINKKESEASFQNSLIGTRKLANKTAKTLDSNLKATVDNNDSLKNSMLIPTLPIKEMGVISVILPEIKFIPLETQKNQRLKKVEIGLIASIGNSWVFNNDVKDGFNRQSLISNYLSLGYSAGAILNYNFTNNRALEIDYDFYSVSNQGYDIYEEGRYDHNHIKFNQKKVTVAYKHRFIKSSVRKRVLVFKSGMYYSFSVIEETSVNQVKNLSNSSYSTSDYGLNLGLGIEHELQQFKIEYGLKTDVGLRNIKANSLNLPKKFDYTTNWLFGGYLSFRYLF